MLVHAILSDSARLCAAWVEFAFRTLRRPAQPNLRCAYEAQRSTTKSDAHKTHKVGVLRKVGRKRCPRKVVGFPVAGPRGGARTPVRRNGTGPSRGKAREGYTSPIPAEIGWMRWVYLGPGPVVRPSKKRFHPQSFFERSECPGGEWNRRVGQQRLGHSSLELLTGPAAASGPMRAFSPWSG
jgi:hypothetical protein